MDDIARYLALLAKDRSIEEGLVNFWPVVELRLPTIVAHLQVFTRTLTPNDHIEQACFERLARVQHAHFTRLLSWRIDDAYVDGVLALHFSFRRATIDRPAIMAIYNELSRALTSYSVEAYRWKPGVLAATQKAVAAAVLFDFSVLLSVGASPACFAAEMDAGQSLIPS